MLFTRFNLHKPDAAAFSFPSMLCIVAQKRKCTYFLVSSGFRVSTFPRAVSGNTGNASKRSAWNFYVYA
jgi:hypothetical protein